VQTLVLVNAGFEIDTANALLRGGAVRQGDGNNNVMAGLSDYDPEVSVLQQYVLETRQEQDDCARKMRALEAQHAIDMEVFSGFRGQKCVTMRRSHFGSGISYTTDMRECITIQSRIFACA
jgi:hypothetical protein